MIKALFERLKAICYPVKFVRMDNAPEWDSLKPICAQMGITMEYTAPYTPQFNGLVEREFSTIRNQAMACLLGSDMSSSEQMLHWAHAVDDCTIARNLQPRGDFENAYVPTSSET
jgi:transposase InsO family protein